MNLTQAASRFLASHSKAKSKVEADDTSTLEAEILVLYEQFRHPLFRYLLSFGLPVSDGEEVLQEVFLALFRHLREAKPRHNLQAWLFRVAHHQALKVRNREEGKVDLAWVDRIFDPHPNPEQEMLQSQRQRSLVAVVRALPEQDRECLVLRAEGLRYREIAAILGISLGAVSISLKRSLAKLTEVSEK